MTKTCSKCKIEKSLQSFPKKGNEPGRKPRLDSNCKKCKYEYKRNSYRKKREKLENLLPKHVPSPGFKTCSKCKIDKLKDGFFGINKNGRDGLNPQCKTCVDVPRRIRNEQIRLLIPKRELSTKTDCVHQRERRKVDPLYRLSNNLRNRTRHAIRGGDFTKSSRLHQYLGCSIKKFNIYIESFWTSGMTWENHGSGPGSWHLDHTIPLASATNEKKLYHLCHYKNIKPMWGIYNIAKSNKMPEEWETYKLRYGINESIPPI